MSPTAYRVTLSSTRVSFDNANWMAGIPAAEKIPFFGGPLLLSEVKLQCTDGHYSRLAAGKPKALTTISVHAVVFWIVFMSLTTTLNPFTASASLPGP